MEQRNHPEGVGGLHPQTAEGAAASAGDGGETGEAGGRQPLPAAARTGEQTYPGAACESSARLTKAHWTSFVGAGASGSPPWTLRRLLLCRPSDPALPHPASDLVILPRSGRPELRGAGRAPGSPHHLLPRPDVGCGADRAPGPGRHPDGGGEWRRPLAVLWSFKDQQQEKQRQHGRRPLMTSSHMVVPGWSEPEW